MPPMIDGISNSREEDEVCPVCKSSRYLNPSMRFLINPECYHKMCEPCVDRIFSSGPANCPVAGCNRTLRKNRFRTQTFEDINVEREVDIRRRVMQILNRREEEFETKRAFDDFLEQREEIVMNLVNGTDVRETERQLEKYASENMGSIRANQVLERESASAFQEQQTLEQEQARLRRQAAVQEYENEQRDKLISREDILRRLTAGKPSDAAAIAREGQKVLLKKSSARRSEEDRMRQKQAVLRGSDAKRPAEVVRMAETTGNTLVKGLKKVKTPEPEKPYDPFNGEMFNKRDYYALRDFYPSNYLDRVRKDTRVQAGGYSLQEYYSRTLLEAFAGLGCFIDDEMSKRESTGVLSASRLGTEGAAIAAASDWKANEETA